MTTIPHPTTTDRPTSVTSVASYWAPRHLLYSAWLEHGPFAFWLIDAARPRTIVELGTHNGYSFFAFCQAVQALGMQCSCYAIDTWQGDEHAGFYNDEVYQGVWSVQQQHYANFSTLVRATFEDARPYFAAGSVDLLHIDGRHTYQDALTDYTTWLPQLSSRAIVVFHDTNVRKLDFGVWKLWSELKDNFPSFEFIHGNGLGVLAVGSEIPDGLRPLFDAAQSHEKLSLVRATYSRLGKACSQEYFAGADASRAAEQLHNVQHAIASQAAQIEALKSSLDLTERSLLTSRTERAAFESSTIFTEQINAAIRQKLTAQCISTELQSRERYHLMTQLEEIKSNVHPLDKRFREWVATHPRGTRWVWAGLRTARLLATFQFGRLARSARAQIANRRPERSRHD